MKKEASQGQGTVSFKRRLLRLAVFVGILLLLLIPSYLAIGSYLVQKNAPQNDSDTVYDSLIMVGPKGNTVNADEGHTLLSIFLSLLENGTETVGIPDSHYDGKYELTMRDGDLATNYIFYFDAQSTDCYFVTPNDQIFLVSDSQNAKTFLNSSYASELYAGAVLPVLTTAATDEVIPSLASWHYRTQTSFTELTNIATTGKTLTYPIANDIVFYFSVQPNHHTVIIRRDGDELYNGPADSISLDLTDLDILDFEIRATYNQDSRLDYYGTLTYRFRMQVVEAASFTLNTSACEAGGLFLLSCRNVKNADKLQLTTTPKLSDNPMIFARGDMVYAAIPAPHAGTYALQATYGTVAKDFSLTVNPAAAQDHTASAGDFGTDWVTLLSSKLPSLIASMGAQDAQDTLTPHGLFATYDTQPLFGYGDTVSVAGTTLGNTPLPFDFYRMTGNVGALSAGRVLDLGEDVLLGKYVIVDHGCGLYTWYAGLSEWRVSTGDAVAKGQAVGIASTKLYHESGALVMATLGKSALSTRYLATQGFPLT